MLKSKNFKKPLRLALACDIMIIVSVSGVGSVAFADENASNTYAESNGSFGRNTKVEEFLCSFEINLSEKNDLTKNQIPSGEMTLLDL